MKNNQPYDDMRCSVKQCPNGAQGGWSVQVDRSRAQNPQVKAEGDAPDKELAPVLDNSIAWGGFVATSTNLRYQTVNAFEERALV